MTDSPDDDASLMAAVARGEAGAFARLVERHRDAAWGLAWRLTGDHAASEDLVQDAFLRVLRAAPRYRSTAAFGTWLHRILTNLAIDRGRRRRARPAATNRDEALARAAAGNDDPAARLDAREREERIAAALAGLPADYRAAVVLRYYEGLDARAMADRLDRSPKAIERLLARARARLEPALRGLVHAPRPNGAGDDAPGHVEPDRSRP